MEYVTKLITSELIASGTMSFLFEKPKGFTFEAGHYIDMTIPDKLDPKDPNNIRSFSIASAPFEPYLMHAVRIRETKFKQTLKQLRPGERVTIQGPLGEFTLPHQSNQPIICLAGGIGITPFHSMLLQIAHEKRPLNISLFYSNRTHTDAPFLAELTKLSETFPFQFIPIFTQEGDSHINENLLKSKLPDVINPVYYLAGPPAMVGGMQAMLYRMHIPFEHIRLDEFTGY